MNKKFSLVLATAACAALVFASACGGPRSRRRTTTVWTAPPPVTHVPAPRPGPPSAGGCQYLGTQQIVCDRYTNKRYCYAPVSCADGTSPFVFCEAVPQIGGAAEFGCPSEDVCIAAPDVLVLARLKRCGSGGSWSPRGSGGGTDDLGKHPSKNHRDNDINNKK